MKPDDPGAATSAQRTLRWQDREDRIALALKGSNIGAWEWKISGGEITAMRHWGHSFGYDPDKSLSAFLEVLHPDERDEILARGRDFLEGRAASFELQHRVRSRGGEWRWVMSRGGVVARDHAGKPVRAVGVFVDITDQKKAQTAALESEERYRAVVESANDAISVIDDQGVFHFLNRTAAERLGGRAEDFVGRTMHELFPPDIADQQLEHVREVIRTRRGIVRESATMLRGEPRMYHTSLQPLVGAEGARPSALMVGRDITERRTAEEELTKLNAQLTLRANQLRALASELTRAEQRERQRVSEVLHDHVQQTLAAAKLRIGMLGAIVAAPDALAVVTQVGDLLSAAIGAVRTLAVEMSPSILKEGSLTAALGWLADDFWKQHGLKVRVEADPGSDGSIDETRAFLFQAVRELLFNVSKHARTEAAQVSVGIVDGKLRLSVSDSGAGFDPRALAQPASAGLGLFSIRERLEALGGTLEIDSARGRGTRVTLTVPGGTGAC
jgi:PAS domain S-box-containing protein